MNRLTDGVLAAGGYPAADVVVAGPHPVPAVLGALALVGLLGWGLMALARRVGRGTVAGLDGRLPAPK